MKRIVLAAAIAILAAAGVAEVPGVASAKETGTSLTLSARDYYYGRRRKPTARSPSRPQIRVSWKQICF